MVLVVLGRWSNHLHPYSLGTVASNGWWNGSVLLSHQYLDTRSMMDSCWVPKNFWIKGSQIFGSKNFVFLFIHIHLRFGSNAFGWNASVPLHLKDQACGVTVAILGFSEGGNFNQKRVVISRSWWNAIVILLEENAFRGTAKTSRKVGLMANVIRGFQIFVV